jgi:glucosamine kinase
MYICRMVQKRILIAESGSTKTDWCFITNGRKKYSQTQGIHPFFQSEEMITAILQSELPIQPKITFDAIYFYGAGVQQSSNAKKVTACLKQHVHAKKVVVESDLLASARALCKHEAGIACIMGTGSNSGYYNGKRISHKTPALGYVLGDEGGGTALGKKVLQYHLHGIFDTELQQAFSSMFQMNADEIMEGVYRKPMPNRFIAQFAAFVFEHRGHYMIENIAEDSMNDFFINHLLRYPQVWKVPVHFSGSVAYLLRDILHNLCEQYEISCGKIIQKPMKDLAAFHTANAG